MTDLVVTVSVELRRGTAERPNVSEYSSTQTIGITDNPAYFANCIDDAVRSVHTGIRKSVVATHGDRP